MSLVKHLRRYIEQSNEAQRDDTWQKAQAYYEPIIQQAKDEARFNLLEWFRNYAHQLDRKFPNPTTEEQGWLGNIWDMIKMAGKEDAEVDFIQQAKAEVAREVKGE